MWLLGTMGCGRSKSASSKTGGGGANDSDNSDFYQKTPTGQGKKDSSNCEDDKQSRNKSHSQGDNNHRMKGQHTNGEVKSNRDNKAKGLEKGSSGPLAPNTNITDSQIEFFRMLDEKIEKGKDYDCVSEQ